MNLTTFTFYKNTPFTQMDNTVHFLSNQERDIFFNQKYEKITHELNFNYVKDNQTLRIPSTMAGYKDLLGCNYLSFISDFEPDVRYYAYIVDWNYDNNKVTEIQFLIDPVMTYTQGEAWLKNTQNVYVERQHLQTSSYVQMLPYLKANNDIIATDMMKYVQTEFIDLTTNNNFYVLFQCSVDLSKPFEQNDVPVFSTSKGQRYDKLISPVDLYVGTIQQFLTLMESLGDFPWVSQNIKNCLLVPIELIDENDLVYITTSTDKQIGKLKADELSRAIDLSRFDMSYSKIMKIFNLDEEQDAHLLKQGICNLTLTTYSSQILEMDLGQLKTVTGFAPRTLTTLGYHNEIRVYFKDYKSDFDEVMGQSAMGKGHQKGAFLDDCIIFSNFDEIPILIDNYKLAWAKGASQRQFSDSKTYSGAGGNFMDSLKSGDFKGAMYSAGTIYQKASSSIGDVINGFATGGLGGAAMAGVNAIVTQGMAEADYWKQQKADKLSNAINTPSVTNQTTGNSFVISNNLYGITAKYSRITEFDLDKVKRYYKTMGYEINDFVPIETLNSMSICNYLRFSGSWWIDGVDTYLMNQLKETLKVGVKFFKPDGTANPMAQNILENKRIL